jgi:hypothetical protein
MARRDEPKFDELQKLLRRLEYMEVDKTPDTPQQVAKEPASDAPKGKAPGYVGALRGAPTIKDEDGDPGDYAEPEANEFAPPPGSKPRQSSAAPVIIGATTAAVVSSMVAVGLLLWTQDKGSGERERMNFVSPTDSRDDSRSRRPADPTETESLLQRADMHIRNGRPTQARALLEQAAKDGSGVAALTLGAIYDPTRVAEFGNLGVQADPTLARAWYERASALGVVEANQRLSELTRR